VTDETFGVATITGPAGLVPAVHSGDRVLPLGTLLGDQIAPPSVSAMLPEWDRWVNTIGEALDGERAADGWLSEDEAEFAAPLPDAAGIHCAGANYTDHVAEMGIALPDKDTDLLYHFTVPVAALTGHRQPVARPACEKFDWEVEIAAVIGRAAHNVAAADALDYVAGYTVANDLSLRDEWINHPIFGPRWTTAKGQEGLKPTGPSLIPASFVPDPMNLGLTLTVNGEVRQDSNTSLMIWTLQDQIEVLSHLVTLRPGTLLLTGTPAGTAAAYGTYLQVGDELCASVEGIGALKTRIV